MGNLGRGGKIYQNTASRKIAGVVGETKQLTFGRSEFEKWVPKAEMTKRELEIRVWSSNTQSGSRDTVVSVQHGQWMKWMKSEV